ncbi:LysE family translocator [Simiduia sp. 21SJ11W-1]|uniref:LysE family translocator n=1 Tax=Simiduia sp. 21SJ11W-1 TaxID=2909669 RepID=UPI00209E7F52|nr:LysE family translocator [Simiduia sp. 21SJ11W-1]UTA46726.1 LysE family translocator [Simiduia sp. 21SJ11W-1]
MPPLEMLIAFTLAALVMNLSPGPSNLYVMARAIGQGVRGGLAATAGLAVGGLVHVLAAVAGLSAIFTHSPTLYTLVKLAGAGYLVYLGINYWRAARAENIAQPQPGAEASAGGKPLIAVFKESILVEVTNPKTALFFLALLPQFVAPEAGPVWTQLLVLGLIVTASAVPCDILVAVSASKVSDWLLTHRHAPRIQARVSGSILVTMGVAIAGNEAVSLAK